MKRIYCRIPSLSWFTFLMVFPVLAIGQINVIPLTHGTPADDGEGFYYCLPRTVITIEVVVEKTEKTKGPFSDYAQRMLGLTNVVQANSVSYSIKDIVINSFTEPDPASYYFVRLPTKPSGAVNVLFNSDGSLRGYKFRGKGGAVPKKHGFMPISPVYDEGFDPLKVPGMTEKVDTIIRRIAIDTITFESITFPKTYIEKSHEQRAREAADFILKLEDDYVKLITGFQEVNYPGESMKFMGENIRKLQREYLLLFKGRVSSSVTIHRFSYVPSSELENTLIPLFRFSPHIGIIDRNSPAGEIVYMKFNAQNRLETVNEFEQKRFSAKPRNKGFYYRVPVKSTISLTQNDKLLSEKELLVSQLGIISFLPARGVVELELNEQTGMLQRLVIE